MIPAQIITIGDEILIGQITDTNSAWIAVELTKMGFSVQIMTSISDAEEAIVESVNNALRQSKLVILTGGLGPTKDDITKTTLSKLFGTPLKFNPLVFEDVEAFIKQRGGLMNPLNRDQALFPDGAYLLRNKQGTAPGMWFEKNGTVLVSLPGVPFEMKGLMQQEVIPKLKTTFALPYIHYQTVMVTGLGESQLALIIEEWENQLPQGMKLAYLPSPGIVKLRLGYVAERKEVAELLVDEQIEKLKPLIPNNIFSDTEELLEIIVGNLLKTRFKTISCAESCTGGTLAATITSVSGASAYFKGGIVAYSNEVKEKLLGVSTDSIHAYGAVSQQVVEQMAAGAKLVLKSDYAIATTGIAGRDGGTPEKPVGTVWIGVATPKKVVSKQFKFGKERKINITRTTIAALNMLRQVLNDETITN
ncbi:MAG: competence/damage-inducible protein A [Salinivirgaceae bacterium]|jgi:nicotinamide-nucleotide amidase